MTTRASRKALSARILFIFALLDRRLGKRRLLALEESMEQELDWVRAFYVTRMQAEGLMDRE